MYRSQTEVSVPGKVTSVRWRTFRVSTLFWHLVIWRPSGFRMVFWYCRSFRWSNLLSLLVIYSWMMHELVTFNVISRYREEPVRRRSRLCRRYRIFFRRLKYSRIRGRECLESLHTRPELGHNGLVIRLGKQWTWHRGYTPQYLDVSIFTCF